MAACPKCGCDEFYAHQVAHMDIICDEDGNWRRPVHDGAAELDIYESDDPFGPFTCVDCGAEYDELP